MNTIVLNPRGVRKAPRKNMSFDGKPTLHAPGCKSIARTEESKPFEVRAMTLNLFDRKEAGTAVIVLAVKSAA